MGRIISQRETKRVGRPSGTNLGETVVEQLQSEEPGEKVGAGDSADQKESNQNRPAACGKKSAAKEEESPSQTRSPSRKRTCDQR